MKVGITGHQRLRDSSSWSWVRESLDDSIVKLGPRLTGISSLAIGADQLFAKLVLARAGELHVVVPFDGYQTKFNDEADRRVYQELLNLAIKVETLPALRTEEESYMAAGKHVVDLSDIFIAVWDGKAAAGLGGTGDVVRYATQVAKTILHINPENRQVRVLTP